MIDLEWRRSTVGAINPRPPGWHNDLIQAIKKLLARTFRWHTRPFIEFNAVLGQSLQEIEHALDDVSVYTYSLDWRLMQLEKTAAEQAALGQTADLKSLAARRCRTTYIIGLFGSGRQYVSGLILQNIGERAKYFRDTIRVHPGPTPMIYSGHATIKYESRAQHLPEVTSRILESIRAGIADLIFVYRHPLDSLLSNWIWWRTFNRENRHISGTSEALKDVEALCACLEENFLDFKAFAEGDSDFFAGLPGAPFLSFAEFVEETQLYLQAATLPLRFEDFMLDPSQQFSKIVKLMSINTDSGRLCLAPPRAKAYGYLAVKEKVPRFRSFITGLDADTKRRIQEIGYRLEA
ncbi:MAG TPA: hypothetical protein VMF91_17085 [Bryobacteraceae bacterium]|nr:hypothetical protein [Bryobacteraceae bacterium]